MNQLGYTQKYLRQRKMLLLMPLLTIPFVTLAFWALGGGKSQGTVVAATTGFNATLPNPHLKSEDALDKLSFYDQAERDSLKLEELLRKDPFYKQGMHEQKNRGDSLQEIAVSFSRTYDNELLTTPYNKEEEPAEDKLLSRLKQLQQQLDKSEADAKQVKKEVKSDSAETENPKESFFESDTHRRDIDPEMEQLDKTLNKILDIQHPERVNTQKESITREQKGKIMTVFVHTNQPTISLLQNDSDITGNASRTSPKYKDEQASPDNSITAVVHNNQSLVNGSVIQLRLLTDTKIGDQIIPAGAIVYGIAQFSDERVNAEIHTIRHHNLLLPVALRLFDMDGLPGIHMPGSTSGDALKQSADNSLQFLELNAMNTSFKTQAATAGLNTIKNLLSKKVKPVKVMVKAGYRVLLIPIN